MVKALYFYMGYFSLFYMYQLFMYDKRYNKTAFLGAGVKSIVKVNTARHQKNPGRVLTQKNLIIISWEGGDRETKKQQYFSNTKFKIDNPSSSLV